jgi:hypothetical protein
VARPPQGLFITQTPERRLRAGTALFGTPISDNVGTIDFPTGQFEAITNSLPAGNYTLTAFALAEQYSARKHVERSCRRSLHPQRVQTSANTKTPPEGDAHYGDGPLLGTQLFEPLAHHVPVDLRGRSVAVTQQHLPCPSCFSS